ncbi:Stp1/IreP family PP2C-type Ser/Thr phosphatase [Paenibacillus yanchengensis]|uniref:Stp1/IreP family PP2C-type Ser/Thr phosphatase n=1 Tax=Paenibacillus yanchengensis TaxID=2035833 RepID=A0ABW4YMF6_9BACL
MILTNRSNVGRVRHVNEDNAWTEKWSDTVALAIVADGMGGHLAGDVASQLAVQAFSKIMQESIHHPSITVDEGKMLMRQAITEANRQIYQLASSDERYYQMGTTIVAAIVCNNEIIIGHVGDSRAYLFSKETITSLTSDHTLVNELVKSGQLTEEEAAVHKRRNILSRAVGTDEFVEIDIQSFPWSTNDILLLCSDGLTNMVSEAEMQQTIAAHHLSLDEKANEFIRLALTAGGDDNITVALIENSLDGQREERAK